jgi:hypothetical protein
MNELEKFKQESIKLGLCEEYRERWEKLNTKRQCIDMISTCQGAQYFISAKNLGIAPSNEYIINEYNRYINGYYTSTVQTSMNYSSQWYIEYEGTLIPESLFTYFLDCDVTINVNEVAAYHFTFAGNTKVKLRNFSGSIVYIDVYGDNVTIVGDKDKVKIRKKDYNLK